MNGELQVHDDVPQAFAELAARRIAKVLSRRDIGALPFRLAVSGGRSGAACVRALAERDDIRWNDVVCYFVDERCVEPTSDDANVKNISEALGERLSELRLFLPMSCDKGADDYDAAVAAAKGFDLVQLGLGPDGHTASLFPGSPGLSAPPDRLVVMNNDPSGINPYERMTLTYEAISRSDLVVFAVIGAERTDTIAAIYAGEDLPAARVRAAEVRWLIDRSASTKIPADALREGA